MTLTWATTAAKYPLAWLKPEPVRPATEPAKRQTPIAWTVLPTNRMSARVANQTSIMFFGRDAPQDEEGRPFFYACFTGAAPHVFALDAEWHI